MATSDDIVDAILELRRAEKWGNARIAEHLQERGFTVAASTVQRTLARHNVSRVRDMSAQGPQGSWLFCGANTIGLTGM